MQLKYAPYILALVISSLPALATPKPAIPLFDTAKIEQITGIKGAYIEAKHVYKLTVPRTDVKVTVDNFAMPPFMGLASWVSFTKGKAADLMIMGDLMLFEDEVNPVLGVLLDSGLKATALHNHFFHDDPHVYFMHINGEGTLDKLATVVGKVFAQVKRIRSQAPTPAKAFVHAAIPTPSNITALPLENIFGAPGLSQDGMFKIAFGREVKMDCGCTLGKDMGINTWAAFAGNDKLAFVNGDFALNESEVEATLKILHAHHFNIVSIHNHMIGETPRMIFAHYWGVGPAAELAKTIKLALATAKKSSASLGKQSADLH